MWALIFGLIIFAQPASADTVLRPPTDTLANRLVTVNRVIIIGNKKTRERIISRELSLKPGDTISMQRMDLILQKDQQRIYNLRLFNTVSVRWLEINSGMADLLIEVNERWYLFPTLIFELSDRNFNEWWENYNHDISRINYGLRLTQFNFRGRNETLRFTAQFGFTRRFELSYRIPYIDRNQKHGLSFSFTYNEPKNLAYQTVDHQLEFQEGRETLKKGMGYGITYTFRKSFYESHSFSFGYADNTVSDSIAFLNSNYYSEGGNNQKYAAITYSFNSEHRDVIAYPLKGYQVTAFIQQAGLGFGDVN
ncbi:MAG TPA: POTRA domain-containing protein, partial [Cyclobacteriaceae bacterium]|nr:POTRA domain-containing protein [Cyclobacteriaceae bacterium]